MTATRLGAGGTMKVLFAPSIPWVPGQKNYSPGAGPDPMELFRLLDEQGVYSRIADPLGAPWNPLAGKAPFLQSIDPVRAARIALFDRDVDVVVSVFEGAAASLAAIKPLVGFSAKLTMWDIGLTPWRIRDAAINFILPRLDRLFVLGESQVGHIQSHYAPCRGGISSIGHYVDTAFYKPADGAAEDDGYILSVGNDVGRDFPTLLTAAAGLDRNVVLKADYAPPHHHDNVRIIRERLSFGDLRSLYRRAAVVVVPTHLSANACGVSTILEASACQRPLIVSDNPAIRDFIIPGETCLTVPLNDPEAMEAALNTLLNDAGLGRRLAANARDFAVRNFSPPAFAERFAAELHSL